SHSIALNLIAIVVVCLVFLCSLPIMALASLSFHLIPCDIISQSSSPAPTRVTHASCMPVVS
ncbi:hypothetical protein BJ165DRAFT_1485080, partial [Panaeolus papilionaceus]